MNVSAQVGIHLHSEQSWEDFSIFNAKKERSSSFIQQINVPKVGDLFERFDAPNGPDKQETVLMLQNGD